MCRHRVLIVHRAGALVSVLAVVLAGFAVTAGANPHPGQSVRVAIVSSPSSINGGTLPTTSADFAAFSFFTTTVANLSLTNLQNGTICGGNACDTVVLNVASSGMGCTTGTLSSGQKTDINTFVQNGGKLIIYDSECAATDYSWLPFPFTTANPGALGATGTLTISDDNILANSNPADPHFIDAGAIATGTDAVGDMNVVTTQDPNWCLSLTGTNAIPVTGATHIYALAGTGMYIYNGMDIDTLGSSTAVSTSGTGQFAKIWLQELQAAAALLPSTCGASVVGIVLAPGTATNPIGSSHTVTATLTDLLGNPEPNVAVTFTVVSGPNAGIGGTCSPANCQTDVNGQVTFTYFGANGVGIDHIQGCFTNQLSITDQPQQEICSQEVTKEWTAAAGVAMKIVSTAAFTLRQYLPGVKDDRLLEVGEFTLPPATTIDPATEQVVVELSEATCGGTFSSLTIPPGSFVRYQRGRLQFFTGLVTDGVTGDVLRASIRILRKTGDTYTISLDLRDADFTCLEGNTNRKVTTSVDIGGDAASGDACFARLKRGDLYFPVKTAVCP